MAVLSQPSHGYILGRAVCKALGLEDHRVARIVIDIRCDSVAVAYIQKHITKDEVEPLAQSLADKPIAVQLCEEVDVDEKGGVTWR